MRIFLHDNRIFKEKELENLNKWLVSKGRQPVANAIFQDVPEDCDIKDFENGVFNETIYNSRKQAEREKKKGDLVEMYVRERYSLSDELAILRQSKTKPDEFLEYYAYAEECKERAKGEINK